MTSEMEIISTAEMEEARSRLERAGIRTTQQRLALCAVLFRGGQRHLTAETLHHEARQAGVRVSAATVYNTLNQFAQSSVIRKVSVGGQRTYFDTDTGDHEHFFIEAEDRILDIPPGSASLKSVPAPPKGYVIRKVDIVVHLERAADESAAAADAAADDQCRVRWVGKS